MKNIAFELYILQFNCSTGNKKLGESCEADIQCSGTDNTGVCGENGICLCATGYLNLQQNCFKGKY